MKRVGMTISNKGGTGKSTVDVLVSDYLIRKGQADRLWCGDAEMSDLQRTSGGILEASGYLAGGHVRVFDLQTDAGAEDFADFVAGLPDGAFMTVDTGANMQERIMGQAEFLGDCMEDGDVEVTIIYIVSPAEESAAALQDLLLHGDGRMGLQLVLMAPEDIPASEYALFKSPAFGQLREAIGTLGIPVHFVGKIREEYFAAMMRDDRLIPSAILEKWQGRAICRRFRKWLENVIDPMCAAILGEAAPSAEPEPVVAAPVGEPVAAAPVAAAPVVAAPEPAAVAVEEPEPGPEPDFDPYGDLDPATTFAAEWSAEDIPEDEPEEPEEPVDDEGSPFAGLDGFDEDEARDAAMGGF